MTYMDRNKLYRSDGETDGEAHGRWRSTWTETNYIEPKPMAKHMAGGAAARHMDRNEYDLQDSSKGGAAETGCSDLYDIIH